MKRNRFVLMNADGGGDAGGAGGSGGGAAGTPPGGAGSSDGGAAPAATWYSTFQSPELRGAVENNGWKSAEDAVRNYVELSRLQGVPKEYMLKLPQKEDDAEGWNQVWKRLGRPDSADEYGLSKLEGADQEFATRMAKAFHDAGAPRSLVEKVMGEYSGYAKDYFTKQSDQMKLAVEADTSKLRGEWGDQYQSITERGGQALKELWGDDADKVTEALQAKLGVYGAAKAIAKLADKAGEATFRTSGEGTGGSSGFGLSPDGAKSEIARLKQDQGFMQDLFSSDPVKSNAARSKMNKLMQVAHPGSAAGPGATAGA